MGQRFLRSFGFLLAFAAITAFVLHPNHVEVRSDISSHCCVCHTVPMGASQPQAVQTPAVFVVGDVVLSKQIPPILRLFSVESPRGPPAA